MSVDVFTNNATGLLAAALEAGDTDLTLLPKGGYANFKALAAGEFQRATITNSAMEGVFEVVYITKNNGSTLTVVRGQEGTAAQDWPSESNIEARITAGMLGRFLVQGDDGRVLTPGKLVVNGQADSGTEDVVQFAGIQMLHRIGAKLTTVSSGEFKQDLNLSVESVGGSPFVDLGSDFTEWAVDTDYAPGAVVNTGASVNGVPQNAVYQSLDGSYTTSAESLGFNPFASAVPAYKADSSLAGQWLMLMNPLELTLRMPVGLVLTEVGFICYAHTATTTPSVSFGIEAHGDLVPATALTAITGANQIQRFTVTPNGPLAQRLKMRVTTPATGQFYGRVYWRGFFVAP